MNEKKLRKIAKMIDRIMEPDKMKEIDTFIEFKAGGGIWVKKGDIELGDKKLLIFDHGKYKGSIPNSLIKVLDSSGEVRE